MLDSYGFEIESQYDWPGRLAGRPSILGVSRYARGERVSLRCRNREVAQAAGAAPLAPLRVAAGPGPGTRTSSTPPITQPAAGWRGRANKMLAAVTGYELRRSTTR
jgi:hypothetical protein